VLSQTAQVNPSAFPLQNAALHARMMRSFVLCCLAASCQSINLLADPSQAASFTQSVQGIMEAAQVGLSRAEHNQEKAVKRARKEIDGILLNEGQALGEMLGAYSMELQLAERNMSSAVNASHVAFAAADAATPPDQAKQWSGPLVDARAKATVEMDAAATAARSTERHDKGLLRQAKATAETALENHADELSHHLGDLSSSVDAAKAKLDSTLETIASQNLPANGTLVVNSKAKKDDITARMTEVANVIKSAQASSQANIAAAKDKVDVRIAKADKELATKVADMVMKLVGQEHAELQKLRSPLTATAVSKLRGAKATMPKHREVHASKTITEKKLKAAP